MDFIQALDPSSLVLLQTSLSFCISPFLAPTYNFPLFLFGIYSVDKTDSYDPLRVFSGLCGVSFFFDIIWLAKTEDGNGFVKALIVLNLLLKIPTFFSVLVALRQRGDRFGASGLGGGGNLHFAEPVWSAPTYPTGHHQAAGGYRDVAPELDTEQGKPLPTAPTPAPTVPTTTIPHAPSPRQPQPLTQTTAPPPPAGAFVI